MVDILLVIFFGLYKVLSILGFMYLICNNHPYMAILLLLVGVCGKLHIET